METNTFYKKLQGEVNSDEFYKDDEIKITVNNPNPDKILIIQYLEPSRDILVRATGDIYFTDSTGQENYGSEYICTANTKSIYYKGTNGCVFVGGKGYLRGFGIANEDETVCTVDMNSIEYVCWTPSSEGGQGTTLYLSLNGVNDDISDLIVSPNKNIYGLSFGSGTYGTLYKLFNNIKQVTDISLMNTKVIFDLALFEGQNNMNANLYSNNIIGDIKYICYNKKKYSGSIIEFNVKSGSTPNIYGSLEGLGLLAKDVIGAGSVKIYNIKKFINVTYQGVSVAESKAIQIEHPIISWDINGIISIEEG